jgi:hypothetical protein
MMNRGSAIDLVVLLVVVILILVSIAAQKFSVSSGTDGNVAGFTVTPTHFGGKDG